MSFRKSIIDKEVVHCDTTLLLYPFKIPLLTIYNWQHYIYVVSRCVRVSVSEGTGARVEVVRVTAGAGAGDGGRGETTGTAQPRRGHLSLAPGVRQTTCRHHPATPPLCWCLHLLDTNHSIEPLITLNNPTYSNFLSSFWLLILNYFAELWHNIRSLSNYVWN